jgi:RNA-directed DNA polymerase
MIRYAVDFVILCPKGRGAEYLARLIRWLEARGLKLNETKTRLVDARRERFKFLGFRLHLGKSLRTRRNYAHAEPHPKSCQKLRDNIRQMLNHWTVHRPVEEVIPALNRKVKGWSAYFHYANSTDVFGKMQRSLCQRVRKWLWRKHKRKGSAHRRFPDATLYQQYRLWRLPTWANYKHA